MLVNDTEIEVGTHHAVLDSDNSYFSIPIYSEIFKIYSFQHLKMPVQNCHEASPGCVHKE